MSDELLITLYKEMYALTEPECGGACRVPRSCCSLEYCLGVQRYAKEFWGVTLEPTGFENPKQLPLLGEAGCVVEPHLRPLCTLHTCAINGLGFKPGPDGEKWTIEYFDLRNRIEDLEWKRETQTEPRKEP